MECVVPTLVEDNTRNQILYPIIDLPGDSISMICEVGSYIAGNIVRLALRAKEQGKYIQFYAVDNFLFENVASHSKQADGLQDTAEGSYFDAFWNNVIAHGVEDYIIAIKEDSLKGSEFFADGCLDLIFLDGCHCYPQTKVEIDTWLPKLKSGGTIAGHDYPTPDVQRGIREVFPDREIKQTSCGSSYYLTVG